MKTWLITLFVLVAQAGATVEDASSSSGASCVADELSGSWPSMTVPIPSEPPYPVVPTHLVVTVDLAVPNPDEDSYYTTPGKPLEYLVTVKNDGSEDVVVRMTVIPSSCLPGWFSWTEKVITVPGGGASSEALYAQPEMKAIAGDYEFEVIATTESARSATARGRFKVQDYDYASETSISGTGQFQLSKDVRSMNSGIKSNKDVYFSGSVDALVKNEYLVDNARGTNPNFEEQDAVDNYMALAPGDALFGSETFKSSLVFGGIGAKVQESYNLQSMEFKDQNFNLHQTGSLNRMAELRTADNFTGYFMLDARQTRPGEKSLKEHEEYMGSFELQRRILFKDRPAFGGSCVGGSCDFMNRLDSLR